MISFSPLWKTMKEKKATTYTLRREEKISSSTIKRLKNNESVSTNTIDTLCQILKCGICDIMEIIPDEAGQGDA